MNLIVLSFGFLGNLHEKELQKVVYLFQMLAWSSLSLVSNGNGKRWCYPLLQKKQQMHFDRKPALGTVPAQMGWLAASHELPTDLNPR